MKIIIKFLKNYFLYLVSILFLFSNFLVAQESVSSDLLDTVYKKSTDTTVMVDGEELIDGNNSKLSKATNYLLQITIAIAVTMILYGGLMIVASGGDEGKMKKARWNIILVALGLILALSSVLIVTIIESISKSSLP